MHTCVYVIKMNEKKEAHFKHTRGGRTQGSDLPVCTSHLFNETLWESYPTLQLRDVFWILLFSSCLFLFLHLQPKAIRNVWSLALKFIKRKGEDRQEPLYIFRAVTWHNPVGRVPFKKSTSGTTAPLNAPWADGTRYSSTLLIVSWVMI